MISYYIIEEDVLDGMIEVEKSLSRLGGSGTYERRAQQDIARRTAPWAERRYHSARGA